MAVSDRTMQLGGKISGVVEALEAPDYPSPHLTAGGGHGMATRQSTPQLGGATEERFWSMVRRVDGAGCWEWQGHVTPRGYGTFYLFEIGPKKLFLAHRVAFFFTRGYHGNLVCHHCDNRRCVRPSHLFNGTHADNVRDCISKGRARYLPKKTHCQRGHEFTPANTTHHPGGRACRTCARNNRRINARARRRAAGVPLLQVWTLEDDALMRQRFPTEPVPSLAAILNRTERAVRGRANHLGIKRAGSAGARAPK